MNNYRTVLVCANTTRKNGRATIVQEGRVMSVKIKISYNTEEELAGVIRLLSPVIKSWKVAKKQEGAYKKAYAELNSGLTPGKSN